MRRVLLLVLVLAASVPALPAAAQGGAGVRLRLLDQTAWNGLDRDHRRLEIRVRAENPTNEDLSGLSLFLTVYAPPQGRLEYEASLERDVTVLLFSAPYAFDGTLEGGGFRELVIRNQLIPLHDRGDTAVYPMKVEL
ncbi:MAG: hypothetical protein LC722_01540, partial [Actinobacteria bacterium]|nr:hypothetical protein [Actinomycetota bacterium]